MIHQAGRHHFTIVEHSLVLLLGELAVSIGTRLTVDLSAVEYGTREEV